MQGEDDNPFDSISLDPLSRTNRAGEVYVRSPDVERQIIEALALSPKAIRRRVSIEDRESSDFLSEECLVYLLRHYFRREDLAILNDLSEALLRRCAGIVRRRLHTLGPDSLKEGQSEIISRLFRRIFAISTDKADFLQVRFWVVMKRLSIQEFNRQLRHHDHAAKALSFSQMQGYENLEAEDGETMAVKLTEADKVRISAPSHEKVLVEADLRRVALAKLEEPLRSAFLLRYHAGWPIENQDPTVPTISRHFGKTPRTIRYWLAKAEETLARWRGGQE